MDQPLVVQAEYSFRGGNNDELCFEKGDVITVTQCEEGGWWEGTLNDKTGWFPSNYVKEYKASLPLSETIRPPEEIQEYRSVVLKDLLESESAHVAEIQGLLENFLEPLQTSQILNTDEYAQLMCNFIEVVQTHDDLYKSLEECKDRVGKLFLSKAPIIKTVHQAYCAAHPRAIVILDKYKDDLEKFMERQGAASPGLLVLTTGLSKPFRRLDKYSAMLQELERHMENSHPDRGDTQRSVAVYKDIAATCSATRRQKELELQVLTGPVRGWQGQELTSLGDIIHMGSVAVGLDHRDRYFVLFPQTLLILSVSQRMSAFIYEGKLPLTGIEVRRLEDSDTIKNALKIKGPLIEEIVAVCQGPNEANKWVELLSTGNQSSNPINIKRNISHHPSHMSPPPNLELNHLRSTPPTITNQPSQHKRSLSFNHHLSYNQYYTNSNQQHQPLPPHHLQQLQNPATVLTVANQNHSKSNLVQISNNISKMGNLEQNARIGNTKANWNITNLQPAPPLRPNLTKQQSLSNNTVSGSNLNALSNYCSSRTIQPTFEEDALVLRVIEAYCAAYQNNSRNTIHSALQPWTPCLPIRGGKLKTSKPFSTSNPQLTFLCGTNTNNATASGNNLNNGIQNSSNNLNSSYIWREASPNYFNMYSASVSSLNTAYRYSLGSVSAAGVNQSPEYQRSSSEERAQRKLTRSKISSGYDNVYMTPLLPRKNKGVKICKTTYQKHERTPPLISRNHSPERERTSRMDTIAYGRVIDGLPPRGLYDRRLNRSFESTRDYNTPLIKQNSLTNNVIPLRQSTPHLSAGDDECMPTMRVDRDSQRFSATWCCGLENEDMTPTLRQLWATIKEIKKDVVQMKLQINEQRALQASLQDLLMNHIETAQFKTKC